MGCFEIEMLTLKENFGALSEINGNHNLRIERWENSLFLSFQTEKIVDTTEENG
jgi:hypothetical protein